LAHPRLEILQGSDSGLQSHLEIALLSLSAADAFFGDGGLANRRLVQILLSDMS